MTDANSTPPALKVTNSTAAEQFGTLLRLLVLVTTAYPALKAALGAHDFATVIGFFQSNDAHEAWGAAAFLAAAAWAYGSTIYRKLRLITAAEHAPDSRVVVVKANRWIVGALGAAFAISLMVIVFLLSAQPAHAQAVQIIRAGKVQRAITNSAPDSTPGQTASMDEVYCNNCSGAPGAGGDASATNQNTQIAAANLTNTRLGDITSPAVGSANYRLGQILSGLSSLTITGALPAGSNTIGTVNLGTLNGAATAAKQDTLNTTLGTPFQAGGSIGNTSFGNTAGETHIGEVGGRSIVTGGTFTTPSGVTAYASGNLIANSATAGSVTPVSITACRVNSGSGMVRRIRYTTTDTGFAGVTVRIHLYRDSPTASNGDHAAWLTTQSTYIGAFDVVLDRHFSDAEKGVGAPLVGGEANFDCASGTQVIFALVEARGAVTPQGAKVHTIAAEIIQN